MTWLEKPTADGAWWQRRFEEEPRIVLVKGDRYLVPGLAGSFPIDANPSKWQRVNPPALMPRGAPVIGSMHVRDATGDGPFEGRG